MDNGDVKIFSIKLTNKIQKVVFSTRIIKMAIRMLRITKLMQESADEGFETKRTLATSPSPLKIVDAREG